ncbi:hypothetical protein LPJ53_002461 [Coemansia erecta]|uniref:ABC transporter domain-containing protein n=1 Tax=Coemansia erecta TaxID=147472 RepID=A0A9W7Y3B4_9FUNG|nr:hypothetical protein LPJ53_002461 [Coemansia erecta]
MSYSSTEPKSDASNTPILSWSNLNYDVKTKAGIRRVLHDISGEVYPGELVAIMGSSGAGKTTLLNVLSGRVQGGRLYGDIKFNGDKRNPHNFKRMVAYVEQDDLLFAPLTVNETLTTSAKLRLPDTKYSSDEKRERVDTVMRQLRLTHVRDSPIGGYGARGVSGGERKRVSIGVELVTDPSILVLDEPSSGLDSSSAEMVVALTKEMSRERNLCTLMTIHQPSAEMVQMFDKLILVSQGKLIYMGPMKQAIPYFESLGFPSTNPNPANFFIDLTTIDFTSDEAMRKSEQHVQSLADSFVEFRTSGGRLPSAAVSTGTPASASIIGSRTPSTAPSFAKSNLDIDITQNAADLVLYDPPAINSWFNEFQVLLKRDWALAVRNTSMLYGLAAMGITTIIFLGFVFFQLKHDQASVQNRIGALFMFALLCSYPIIFPVISLIISGRSVLVRERSAGMYRMTAYFFAKSFSFFPLALIPYTITYIGVYFIAHFQYDAAKFFIGLANTYVLLFTAIGFAFGIAMLVQRIEVALIIAPVTMSNLILFAGNLANSHAVTPVLRWIKYLCMYYYSYAAFMQNEFGGLEFTCDEGSSSCYRTGEDVIKMYGLDAQAIWLCIILNLVLGIGNYIIAYSLTRWLAKPRYLWI